MADALISPMKNRPRAPASFLVSLFPPESDAFLFAIVVFIDRPFLIAGAECGHERSRVKVFPLLLRALAVTGWRPVIHARFWDVKRRTFKSRSSAEGGSPPIFSSLKDERGSTCPTTMTPEDFFEFIDRGGGSGLAGHHLMGCPECLFELDFLLLAEVPATAGEEAILDGLPAVTVERWRRALWCETLRWDAVTAAGPVFCERVGSFDLDASRRLFSVNQSGALHLPRNRCKQYFERTCWRQPLAAYNVRRRRLLRSKYRGRPLKSKCWGGPNKWSNTDARQLCDLASHRNGRVQGNTKVELYFVRPRINDGQFHRCIHLVPGYSHHFRFVRGRAFHKRAYAKRRGEVP